MIHRFDIFEMPKELQVNLTANNSLMQADRRDGGRYFPVPPQRR